MNDTRKQLNNMIHEREKLEKQVSMANTSQHTLRIRESIAFNKIQEALNLAEVAISEKNAALVREKDITGELDEPEMVSVSMVAENQTLASQTDECNQLATTISRVMEEAGNKVDNDVDELKRKFNEKIRKLENVIRKV